MEGLAELKVKESDRLSATVIGLVANGVAAKVDGDTMIVAGAKSVKGGGTVATHMDHRIAMAFLILGLNAEAPVTIDDMTYVATSFPSFQTLMTSMGAKFEAV
jgi:3-phosphoshikimate 1-carboxyvinyltransferase